MLRLRSSNPPPHERRVQCYHCRRDLVVPSRAITLTCPLCSRPIHVQDIVIAQPSTSSTIRTCGLLTIRPRASLCAQRVEARAGATIEGRFSGDLVSGMAVRIARTAVFSGACSAPSIIVEPGATIAQGRMCITPATA